MNEVHSATTPYSDCHLVLLLKYPDPLSPPAITIDRHWHDIRVEGAWTTTTSDHCQHIPHDDDTALSFVSTQKDRPDLCRRPRVTLPLPIHLFRRGQIDIICDTVAASTTGVLPQLPRTRWINSGREQIDKHLSMQTGQERHSNWPHQWPDLTETEWQRLWRWRRHDLERVEGQSSAVFYSSASAKPFSYEHIRNWWCLNGWTPSVQIEAIKVTGNELDHWRVETGPSQRKAS